MLGNSTMVKWKIFYTKRAQDDSVKLKKCGLQKKNIRANRYYFRKSI
jgi:hypothetical protein